MAEETWFGTAELPKESRLAVPELTEHLNRTLDDLDYPVNSTSMNPVVLPQKRYTELFDATRQLLRLLRRALFGIAPDFHGRLRALGAVEENYPLWVQGPLEETYATCMTRPDIAIGPTGPKFLEFNIGSGIGGVVETSVQSAVWKAAYGGADAAPFRATPDPLSVRDQIFVRAVRDLGTPPAVAIVGALREFNAVRTTRYFDIQVQSLRGQGLQAEYFEPEQLLQGLGLGGGRSTPRYRLGLRHFTIFDWTRLGIDLAPMRSALDAECFLIASQSAYLVANKKVLGWVSEGLPWMTAEDHALVERYLPWTRTVSDRQVRWRGTTRPLPELLLSEREDFVLKPAIGLGSHGVVLGRHVDDVAWRTTLDTALSTGQYIAQEYVEPVPYRVELRAEGSEETYETEVHPVLSPFLFDGQPGGCLVRYLPPGRAGVTTIQGNGALPSVALPV
ncbi:hypothetical protein OG599_32355 [Streptomyces sp. NBC_01335]|uniref:hypothetical protein n=1 Tax=Streptomyces sp. NBC_01335 TaxID=2903828 RepID=UPI002E1069D8|nr:hypothetical protein OG599_32355 [Streptomyces sp. NBC_01335]